MGHTIVATFTKMMLKSSISAKSVRAAPASRRSAVAVRAGKVSCGVPPETHDAWAAITAAVSRDRGRPRRAHSATATVSASILRAMRALPRSLLKPNAPCPLLDHRSTMRSLSPPP